MASKEASNSLHAIQSCIDLGVDIVEIDIRMTKDGVLILNHDKDFKRTGALINKKNALKNLEKNGDGNVRDYTYAEIQKYFVMRNGAGAPTPWKFATLKEAMQLAKGKILVNVDKASMYIDKVQKILEETGTTNQVIYKGGAPYNRVRKMYGALLDKIIYMPITSDSNKNFSRLFCLKLSRLKKATPCPQTLYSSIKKTAIPVKLRS